MNDFFAWNMGRPRPWEEQPPLTQEDCDELFRLFDEAGLPSTAMTAEMADGYLTACCVGPKPVPVHEWMEAILGQATLPICAEEQAQDRLLTLLLRRHQNIQDALLVPRGEATVDNIFIPLTADVDDEDCIRPYQLDANGDRLGQWELKDWAEGFRRAMFADPEWDVLLDDAQAWPLVTPMILFQKGYNPDKPDMQVDEREDLIPLLVSCVYDIRKFWRNHDRLLLAARAGMNSPLLREATKVGRNEPCPCGSGKKYKKCCGA